LLGRASRSQAKSELGKSAKVDADTKYVIASNTKAMATLMLAKLVDAGKLTWETPATSAYLNPMAPAAGFLGGHVAYPELELGAAYDRAMQDNVHLNAPASKGSARSDASPTTSGEAPSLDVTVGQPQARPLIRANPT
jgi:Beta-lactamase